MDTLATRPSDAGDSLGNEMVDKNFSKDEDNRHPIYAGEYCRTFRFTGQTAEDRRGQGLC
jgi:hypothetical protein